MDLRFHINIKCFHNGYSYYLSIKFFLESQDTKFNESTHATIQMDKCNDGHIPTCIFGNKTNMLSCSALLYSRKCSTNMSKVWLTLGKVYFLLQEWPTHDDICPLYTSLLYMGLHTYVEINIDIDIIYMINRLKYP